MAPEMDASSWDRRYVEHPSPWTDEPNRFLVEAVRDLRPGRALDLACGEGRNTLWLAKVGWNVVGVDFSAVAVGRAQDVARERGLTASFERHDLTEWKPTKLAFDLVTLVYLQLPAADMASVLRSASQALAPGGALLVVGHHLDNLSAGYGGPQSADVLYTESDLAKWSEGLELATVERVSRAVETDGGPRTAIDALLIARR